MTENIILFGQPIPLINMDSVWIEKYRANRYLHEQNAQQLTHRLSDIAQNLMTFDEKTGKYVPNYNLSSDGIYMPVRNLDWLKMATEVYEEFRLRCMDLPDLPSQAPIAACEKKLSKTGWANRPDLVEVSKPSLDTYEVPNLLFRYSTKKYNKQFVDLGRVRVVPASSYNDACLNRARRDNEKIMEVNEFGGHFETDDFLTVCFSAIYDYRVYCEFEADSCVVVNSIPKFMERFNDAVSKYNTISGRLRIAKVVTCPTIYYDPFNVEPPTIADEIFLTKPFRFAYQYEFRLVILPTKPQPLDVFFLELGSLSDITELVCDT